MYVRTYVCAYIHLPEKGKVPIIIHNQDQAMHVKSDRVADNDQNFNPCAKAGFRFHLEKIMSHPA